MIHPLMAILSVAGTFAISLFLFSHNYLPVDEYFFITVPLLIGIYSLLAMLRDRTIYRQEAWSSKPFKILFQYSFWGALIFALNWIYSRHSFYLQVFPEAKTFTQFVWDAYLYLGLPYFLFAHRFRSHFQNDLNDPALYFLSLFRQLAQGKWKVWRRIYQNRHYRLFVISSLLRAHFIGLMVGQMHLTHSQVTKAFMDGDWSMSILVAGITALVWSVDANNASIGYFWESRFTRTRFKEMDPYPLHWLVTIGCYIPFSWWVSVFFPSMLDSAAASQYAIKSEWFFNFTDCLGIFFLVGYVLSGTSLYFSTSNMTYKAIQTKGFYALVRHPATFFKLGYFCVLFFKYEESYTWLKAVAFGFWMLVYVARTWCEEGFLKKFPEYQEYQKKTPYRIIPYIY